MSDSPECKCEDPMPRYTGSPPVSCNRCGGVMH